MMFAKSIKECVFIFLLFITWITRRIHENCTSYIVSQTNIVFMQNLKHVYINYICYGIQLKRFLFIKKL